MGVGKKFTTIFIFNHLSQFFKLRMPFDPYTKNETQALANRLAQSNAYLFSMLAKMTFSE
jgi:hypothetical protein